MSLFLLVQNIARRSRRSIDIISPRFPLTYKSRVECYIARKAVFTGCFG